MTTSSDTRDSELVARLLEWLRKRGEPDSGLRYEGQSYDLESGRLRQSSVELHGSDADYIAKHFHGQGARALADTIDRLTSSGEAVGWQWSDFSGKWYSEETEAAARARATEHEGRFRALYTHASPREGHAEVPVESEMRTLAEHCAGLMNKLSNRGHTGLMQECPLCQAYIGAARLLAHETDTPMPDEVVIWDRRLEAAALPHNQGETKP